MDLFDAYPELVALCQSSDVFYFADQQKDDRIYRIFNYRLSSYSDWAKHTFAKELRGLMFEVDSEGRAIRIAARPMGKFFNLNENPEVMGLNLKQKARAAVKMDGSLISTYIHNGRLCLKSKGSINSTQVHDATAFLEKQGKFYWALLDYTYHNHTIDMEWTAPQNRIVIGYEKPALTILSIRHNLTGIHRHRHQFEYHGDYGKLIMDHWVQEHDVDDAEAFIATIGPMKDIEGFVVQLEDGTKFKCKTDKYSELHRLKDDVSNPKKVAAVILSEGIDDFKAAFSEDKLLISMIERMEDVVRDVYNKAAKRVDEFYEKHKHLDRKSFAIAGQQEFKDSKLFSQVMNRYLGKPSELKTIILKFYEDFFPEVDWYAPTGVSS